MKMKLLLLISVFGIGACTDSNEELASIDGIVDQELQSFVRSFESEAAKRGIEIDIAALGIKVELADIPQDNVAGVCYYHSHNPGRIEIDAPFYNSMSTLQREYVVFHELGHCVLGRGHSEAQFNTGACQSIMASGTGNCRDNYNVRTRTSYINELFNDQS